MHEVGGIEDHVHTVFSLPPKYAVADFIGTLKGASSHWVTHEAMKKWSEEEDGVVVYLEAHDESWGKNVEGR